MLLLGGPNTYLPFLQDCWRLRIPADLGRARLRLPEGHPDRGARLRPGERAVLRGASAPCVYGLHEDGDGRLATRAPTGLIEFITNGRKARLGETAGPPLSKDEQELDDFRELYKIPKFIPAKFEPGQKVRGVIGLDGGSTSSKAVLVDYEDGEILCKAYQLSKGNPIQDTKELLAQLKAFVTDQGAELEVHGLRRDRLRRRRARGVRDAPT